MAKQKWRNRTLERGVVIDRARGYVYVRFKTRGIVRKELMGRTSDPNAIDKANFRAHQIRHQRRAEIPGFDAHKQRLLVEDAADIFLKLHGEKRQSRKGAKQFVRYARLIKEAWSGRYIDSVTGDDMRDYRMQRRRQGVSESTVNREHTAIITMFNRLAGWRRSGQISRTILLPENNPGTEAPKVNEDRFIRNRLLSDAEYQNLWASADNRLRRIILVAMNLPLRLEDMKRLKKDCIDYKRSQFRGVQAKTGQDYALPINGVLWDIIQTAPGNEILDFKGFVRRWRRAVKRAGLKGLQFRDLRRTAATTLHEGGESLKTISTMLGHSGRQAVTTTVRYLGLKEENLKGAGKILEAKYRPPVETAPPVIQSVPKSVPTISKNGANEIAERIEK